jgi:predicted RNase H-like HicB family nuclease
MELEIYGFKAKIVKDGKHYAATVKELNANTQGKSLSEVKKNLKEAVALVFEDVLKRESSYNKALVKKVKTNVRQNLA